MANISAIKLPNNVTYDIKDNGALQLTGGQVTGPVTFGDSVSIDEATLGDLVVNGSASFTNNIQANTINGVTVGSFPKFTDTTNTTGSSNLTGSKLYIIGATQQASSTQTYSNNQIYIDDDNTFHINSALAIKCTDNSYHSIFQPASGFTANRVYILPNKAGTIALTSDIPTVPSNIVNTITTTAGTHTAITSQKGNVSFNVPTTAAHVGIKFGYTTSGNNRAVLQDNNGNLYVTQKDDNTNTTYSLSGALSSHKFTSTLTAGGSGSGTSTATIELVAGTGITLTDDTTNKKITITSAIDSVSYSDDTHIISNSEFIKITDNNGNNYYAATYNRINNAINALTIPSITLNGTATTSPSFYAPTTVGTNGYVLKSTGSGAPAWTSATLTDTQVTSTAVTAATEYYLTGSSSSTTTGKLSKHGSASLYVDANTNTAGSSRLTLGNATIVGTAGAKLGVIRLYGSGAYFIDLVSGGPTLNRTITLPNATGTLALNTVVTAGSSVSSGGLMSEADKTRLDSLNGSIFVSNTAPTGSADCLWIDTANSNVAKFWNNSTSSWQFVNAVWG